MGEVAPLDFTESVAVSIDVSKPFPTISNPRNSKVIEYYLTGASVRGTQVLVDAAIWIAVGCLVAAIFRNWGPEQTRSVFGDQTRFGLLIGWLLGMLLPVCSLGVIPVVRELHRAGVKGGTIIAFGLTAPLFNPMSVLYGLTLSDPIAILSFSFCALLIVSCLGFLWDPFFSSVHSATRDRRSASARDQTFYRDTSDNWPGARWLVTAFYPDRDFWVGHAQRGTVQRGITGRSRTRQVLRSHPDGNGRKRPSMRHRCSHGPDWRYVSTWKFDSEPRFHC